METFMRHLILLWLASALLFSSNGNAQSSPATLDLVAWNVEWFGASFQDPADDDLQEQNVKKILRHLNADLYALSEIVDSMRLRRVTDSLGPDYRFIISPFCSNNSTGTGTSWLNGQKLAFIYNKNIFTNVSARGLMRNSGPAYTNFASGRFPYMLTADVTLNGVTKNMNFIVIHGKAGSTPSDYQRRKDGAQELKDTLDAFYSSATTFLLGDFNDALNQTICSGCGTSVSSYDVFVKDSTDSDHYKSITLPLALDGQSSTTSFPNVIDNHVISNEAYLFYIPNSASIRVDVLNVVPNYAFTTSDHYPVFSKYNLSGVSTGLPTVTASVLGIGIHPNPFGDELRIKGNRQLSNVLMQLIDGNGKVLRESSYKIIPSGTMTNWNTSRLAAGVYYLRIQTREYQTVVKLIHF